MDDDYISVDIDKPIHGTYISIDKRKIDLAMREGKLLRVTIKGLGSALVTPEQWLEGATIKSEIKNYPSNPMIFCYNTLRFKKEEVKEKPQLSLF